MVSCFPLIEKSKSMEDEERHICNYYVVSMAKGDQNFLITFGRKLGIVREMKTAEVWGICGP